MLNSLSEYKVKKIILCFCEDIDATKTSRLLGINRKTINRYFHIFREKIFYVSLTVFYILEQKDTPEIVYTSITRSKRNLVVFDISNKNIASSFVQETKYVIYSSTMVTLIHIPHIAFILF